MLAEGRNKKPALSKRAGFLQFPFLRVEAAARCANGSENTCSQKEKAARLWGCGDPWVGCFDNGYRRIQFGNVEWTNTANCVLKKERIVQIDFAAICQHERHPTVIEKHRKAGTGRPRKDQNVVIALKSIFRQFASDIGSPEYGRN